MDFVNGNKMLEVIKWLQLVHNLLRKDVLKNGSHSSEGSKTIDRSS